MCTDGEYPALVLEYCGGGSLERYIQTHLNTITDAELIKIARDIALGMKYLHKSGIIHRDLGTCTCQLHSFKLVLITFPIALRNILLVGGGPTGSLPHCKISDFGLSREYRADRTHTDAHSGLPIRWMVRA